MPDVRAVADVEVKQEHVSSPLIPRTRATRALFGLVVMALATAATFGILELGLRLLVPQSIMPRYVEASSYGIRKNIGHVRGEMITADFRHEFSTNSQGFRGQVEYAVEKPQGTFRVIVLGDSVTLGHGVKDNETFSAVAERKLNQRRPVEVINMGVSGFGTAEELIQLEEVGLRYQPDLVVLAYFPNDPYNNVVSGLFTVRRDGLERATPSFTPALYVRDHLSAIPGYSFLCQQSHLLNFVRARLSAFFMDRLGRQYQTSTEIRSELTPGERLLTEAVLRDVYRSTWVERGLPLVVLNIPVVLEGRVIQNFPVQRLAESGDLVEVVDVSRSVYQGRSLQDLSYQHDSHPKPQAHRLIGEELAGAIERIIERLPKPMENRTKGL